MPYTASQAPSLTSSLDASHGWPQKRVHLNKRSSSHDFANDSLRLYTGDFTGHRRSIKSNEVFLKLGHLDTSSPTLKHSRRLSLPEEEQPMETAPTMVRKKSGELVKSCVKKGSKSAPATPTWPKYVHFDSQLEHVRHFHQTETPSVFLEDIEPLDLDTASGDDIFNDNDHDRQPSLNYPNWPYRPSTSVAQMISVESVLLSPDKKSLTGRVRVQNIAYQKQVMVRYTFDLWKTFNNVEAAYREPVGQDPQNSAIDRFMFNIQIPPIVDDTKDDITTMFFAVQYNIDNCEFWDNNTGMNYQIDILRQAATPRASAKSHNNRKNLYLDEKIKPDLLGAAVLSLSSSPPSLSSSPNLSTKTQFGRRYNFGKALSHVQGLQPTSDPQYDDHHHRPLKRTGTFPSYFSSIPGVTTAASLDEALTSRTIHTAISDDEKLNANMVEQHQQSQQQPQQHPFIDSIRMPSPANTNKPAAWTAGYFDLINKYCFYNGGLSDDNSGSTSPSLVDPASVYGEPLVSVLVNHNVIQG